ncbi:MAG TPA: hypothetical protein VJ992_12170 [Gemmatimonadales bacterium]|jgi:hypothetical protein|nr:hypothetical protein [Gemmatimonadales bacterium]
MSKHNPFDQRPDVVLGQALRDALSAPDDAAFVRRVMARAAEPAATWWDVLGTWARPGLAAALVAAAVVGFWIGHDQGTHRTASLDDPLTSAAQAAGAAPVLFDAAGPPTMDVVLAVAGDRN